MKVVEQNLVPVGITGIEDTLRDNVKETISVSLLPRSYA